MKPSGQQQQQQPPPIQSNAPYYPPPPSYTLPGQDPPKDTYSASAPPPGMTVNGGGGIQQQPQQQQSPQPMIIYSNTTVQQVQFGPYPMRYTCPNCGAHVMTETHSTPGVLTYILCFLTGSLLCCLIPFCIRECKDIEHRCPNCQHKLGLFKRI